MFLANDGLAACNSVVDPRPFVQQCIKEMCLCDYMNNEDCLCDIGQQYARVCAFSDVLISDWRSPSCGMLVQLFISPKNCSWLLRVILELKTITFWGHVSHSWRHQSMPQWLALWKGAYTISQDLLCQVNLFNPSNEICKLCCYNHPLKMFPIFLSYCENLWTFKLFLRDIFIYFGDSCLTCTHAQNIFSMKSGLNRTLFSFLLPLNLNLLLELIHHFYVNQTKGAVVLVPCKDSVYLKMVFCVIWWSNFDLSVFKNFLDKKSFDNRPKIFKIVSGNYVFQPCFYLHCKPFYPFNTHFLHLAEKLAPMLQTYKHCFPELHFRKIKDFFIKTCRVARAAIYIMKVLFASVLGWK